MANKLGTLFVDVGMDTGKFIDAVDRIKRDLNSFNARVKRLEKDVVKSFKNIQKAMVDLSKNTIGLLGAGLAGYSIKSVVELADKYKSLQGRIKLITTQTGDYVGVSRELSRIAKETGSTLEDNVDVFQRLSMGAKSLGKSNKDVLSLLRIVDELGAVSNASDQAMQAGLLQFGQAMSAGVVRAEEFNSILENLPALAERIAKGLGVSQGQLRQMVLDGKLLSKDVFDALLKQAGDIHKQFMQMPSTMARGWNSLQITIMEIMGEIDKSTGITNELGNAFKGIADEMVRNKEDIINFISFVVNSGKLIVNTIMGILNTFGFLTTALVESVVSSIEGMVNEAVTAVNFISKLANNIPGVKISMLNDSDTTLSDMMGDARRKAFDAMTKSWSQAGKDWNAVISGGGKLQSNVAGSVSDTHGKADPLVDKNAAKEAEKIKKLVNELNAETAAIQRLGIARLQGEESYGRMKMLIEAENEIRNKNLKLTDKQREALIKQAYANKIGMNKVDALGQVNQLNRELEQADAMIKAIREGREAVNAAERKAFVENSMAGLPPGLSQKQRTSFQNSFGEKFDKEKQTAFETAKQAAKEQLDYQNKLVDAQKLGNIEAAKQKMILDSINEAKQQGAVTDAQIKELSKQILDAKLAEQEIAVISAKENLTTEADNMRRLLDARLKGVKSYQEMQRVISAENEVRQLGLDLLSTEGQLVYRLAYDYETYQATLEKASEAMQSMEDFGKQMGETLGNAFSDMITGAKSFRDVMVNVLNDIANQILRMAVTEPLAKGLGSFFGKLGGRIAGSIFGGGAGANGGLGPIYSATPVPAFADGGMPPVGVPSIVGERGPELFVPKTAGTIIPNHALGGGPTINVYQTYQISTGVVPTVRAEIARMMPEISKRIQQDVRTAIGKGGPMARSVGATS